LSGIFGRFVLILAYPARGIECQFRLRIDRCANGASTGRNNWKPAVIQSCRGWIMPAFGLDPTETAG
jgi:hypothetical protein